MVLWYKPLSGDGVEDDSSFLFLSLEHFSFNSANHLALAAHISVKYGALVSQEVQPVPRSATRKAPWETRPTRRDVLGANLHGPDENPLFVIFFVILLIDSFKLIFQTKIEEKISFPKI